METEIWPNLFRMTANEGVPILIINGRLSERSVKGYRKLGQFVSNTLAAVKLIAAQTPADAERYRAVGVLADRVCVPGNIKFDVEVDAATHSLAEQIKREVLGGRPTWIAGSIHPGEDDALIDAWIECKQDVHDLLLILAPRHPERSDEIARDCERRQLFATRRSRGEVCSSLTDVFILDTIGELKTFYSASNIAFVGGSLIPHGGQNVLEPAAAGIPVFFGPHTANFKEITRGLIEREGAVQIQNTDEIAPLVIQLLQDGQYRSRLTQSATEFLAENRGAVERVVALITDQLNLQKA
jgi:3-deoxy-D-manno-octulosonic-acid transferase